ncbi:MAG: GNAT family N-acetyltransferase, partial [Nocardioides sp.]|nr:GNAT family N-acetyltransferase [Nocardioides sp.]
MTSPTADVSVRVAWADDAPGIAAVQVRAWQAQYADLLPADVLGAMSAEDIAALWRESLNKPKDARNRVLVALERNRITGFAVTAPADDPDCNPIDDGEVGEFCIDPAEQRLGHGSRLLQAGADT